MSIIPNTPKIRTMTAADKMATIFDEIEAEYLSGNHAERKVAEYFGTGMNILDIGSAASMNLFHDTTEKKAKNSIKKGLSQLLEKFYSYPSLIQKDYELEQAFVTFMRKWTKMVIPLDDIMVTNGVYGSYKTILLSRRQKMVLIPELVSQVNKACFASLGKTVCEVPMILETGLIDLVSLDRELKKHARETACVYIYHPKPVKPITRQYYLDIARILHKHDVLGAIDFDAWYTSYLTDVIPWLPLTIPELRKQCLFLFTMTKEIGAPGLRIGFVVGPKKSITNLKIFQRISLELVSPVTRFLTSLSLPDINMNMAQKTLQRRMKTLVDGLNSLNFHTAIPPSGVNFFLHVPESFASSDHILPDHLFSFYVLKETGVLVRPASNYGHRFNHWVRFVLGQPEKNIREVIRRFRLANIRGDMPLPEGLEKEYERVVSSL